MTTTHLPSKRAVKQQIAIQHELVGFPAGLCHYEIEQAAKLIQIHIAQLGASEALSRAMDTLDRAAGNIERWRQADMERTAYPYQRPVGHA